MAKEQTYWERDSSVLPGVDETVFQEFESRHGITLPPFLKEMYRLQNGGGIQNAEQELVLLPIGTPDAIFGQMRSLEDYASADGPSSLTSIYLDWIEEEFKNPACVIVIASYGGHVVYALNYGSTKAGKEPSVVALDFECVDKDKVAPTFEKWIKKLSKVSSGPSVNWSEIEKYEVLYRSSFQYFLTMDGTPEVIENVLCKSGEMGLIHFEKKEWKGQVTALNRCSIENGVAGLWFKVKKFRPDPNGTFTLHLQPSDFDDIRWVMDEWKSGNRWKTRKMKGAPGYCTVESQDKESLESLADLLRQQGLVDSSDVSFLSGLSPKQREMMDQFKSKYGTLTGELARAEAANTKYTPDFEFPVIHRIDPAMKSEEENLAELTRIVLSWAGQIQKIQTAEDAHLFQESFRPYLDRFKEISRHQGRTTNLDSKLLLVKDPLREEIRNLMRRDRQAYDLIENQKREVEWDASRTFELGEKIDSFLIRYDKVAHSVANCLKSFMETKTLDPESSQPVFEDFEKIEAELNHLSGLLGEMAGGWLLGKRRFGQGYRDLAMQLDVLKTNHRSLFKKHRQTFQKLSDLIY
ncbi:MAG: SMI1/KNR4 family protein [Planctomycetaceae bacterium]|nr:SMI1/KNR4 family protein [Planctomycetaceae bacterium]